MTTCGERGNLFQRLSLYRAKVEITGARRRVSAADEVFPGQPSTPAEAARGGEGDASEAARSQESPGFGEDGHHLQRPVVDWSKDLEGRMADEEIHRLLLQVLDQLLPMDRMVVVLSDLEGRSVREIGAALGLTVSAVKARLHRARLFLRGKLAVGLGYSPT
jgi:RNA polymerase sigma factor (sigma-70 family)